MKLCPSSSFLANKWTIPFGLGDMSAFHRADMYKKWNSPILIGLQGVSSKERFKATNSPFTAISFKNLLFLPPFIVFLVVQVFHSFLKLPSSFRNFQKQFSVFCRYFQFFQFPPLFLYNSAINVTTLMVL